MDKKNLSERDNCPKLITPVLHFSCFFARIAGGATPS